MSLTVASSSDFFRWETTTLMVAYDTPLSVLDELRTRYRAYIAENSREWAGCDFNMLAFILLTPYDDLSEILLKEITWTIKM